MRTSIRAAGALFAAFALVHCGPPVATPDAAREAGSTPDAAAPADARPDGSSTGPSSAGAACMDDSMCTGGLTCDLSVSTPGFCTGMCENAASQANEQSQCGGTGSTCLTSGDPPDSFSFCTKACNAASMTTGCRAGQVCTGFWNSHEMGPDRAGCFAFCTSNDQCPSGQMCNTRTGDCGMTASNPALLADGSPCTIPATNAPSPCRGVCFRLVTGSNRGLCGSIINGAVNRECPDSPMEILPRAPAGDNLAFCLFRDCDATTCCGAGLVCEGAAGATMGVCVPDDPASPNIACTATPDGGAPDGSAPDASAPDASAPDAAPADAATGG